MANPSTDVTSRSTKPVRWNPAARVAAAVADAVTSAAAAAIAVAAAAAVVVVVAADTADAVNPELLPQKRPAFQGRAFFYALSIRGFIKPTWTCI